VLIPKGSQLEARMRKIVVGLGPTLALAASVVVAQQQFTFFASLLDASGNPPASLTPADIRVQEGGTDGKVLKVEPVSWPMKVTLLIDNGAGLGQSLLQIRVGAKGFIDALPDGVETALLTTAPQPRFIVRPTMDKQALAQGVDRITPDSGAARFSEALIEAATRIDRDKTNHFPVIVILGSTAAEGSAIIERDLQRMLGQLTTKAATVHVVMVSVGQSASAGALQTQVGIAASKQTGGRYEAIAAVSRIATLLPEIGAQVARSHQRQSRQFRITYERPSGARGQVGAVGMSVPAGFTPTLSLDGHLP
jgi:hypothetical protein